MRAALILAGGRGERFWPWSRPGHPKQLLPLADGRILLAATLDRLEGLVPPEGRWILTSCDLQDAVRRVVGDRARVLAEPVGRNTAPAVGLAAMLARAVGADEAMAVLPSDHLVAPLDAFQRDVRAAWHTADTHGRLVTLGIPAARAETAYGYLERGDALPGDPRARAVKSFREKPDAAAAERYLAAGGYLWNSGMFFWRPADLLAALAAHRPALAQGLAALEPAARAFAAGDDGSFDAALAYGFGALESISIDYAVMEKAPNAAMIEAGFEWDDLGSWTAWGRRQAKDTRGNAAVGRALAIDSDDCVVLGGGERPVVVLGGRGLVVVQEAGGTLVCPADRVDEVRQAVGELQGRGWLVGGEGS